MIFWQEKLREGIITGLKEGWGSFIWVIKIVIPVSFAVTLIQWSGVIYRANSILGPLMRLLQLPVEAAIPIVSGFLLNIYATVAAMSSMPFSPGQVTLISVFSMIAHGLIQEGIVQSRCGISPVKIILFRVAAATLAVLFISVFFKDTAAGVTLPAALVKSTPVLTALKTWAFGTLVMTVRIFVILMSIMTVLGVLRVTGWIAYLTRLLSPVMKALGLTDRSATLWLTAGIFGLTYAAGIIIEEARRGSLDKNEIEDLHVSIGINHSIIEDPVFLLSLGVSPVWLWVPRIVLAILAVHLNRLLRRIRRVTAREQTE